MPTVTPEVNLGHLITVVTIICTAAMVYGAQTQETKELREWLMRHEAQIQKNSDMNARQDILDTTSVEERKQIRENIFDLKVGMKEILNYIRPPK